MGLREFSVTRFRFSHWLHVAFVHFYGDGAHDEVQGKDHSAAVFPAHDNAFESLHRPAAHAHPAAHAKVRMRFNTAATREPLAQLFDFCFRQNRGLAIEAHQAHGAGQLQNSQPVLQSEPHKYVAGK